MKRLDCLQRIAILALVVVPLLAAPVLAHEVEEEEAPPEPNWKSALGLSYVGTSGNTDTSSFGLDLDVERRPAPWGLNLLATFTRAEDGATLTAEQYLVGARATRELSERWSLFAGASWARDTFGGFENRWIGEVGAAYLAVDSDRHTLSFDLGLTWTSEDRIFTDDDTGLEFTETVDWFGAVAGLDWEWKFSKNASLTERLLFYPNFDDSSDWRVGSDTAVQASLTELLALKFSYLVRHRNKPIDDLKKTDTTTKVSVVLNF